ncbi:MAG: ATP-binding protein [Muribaculaceae bacterium]|nr:ATP-binding protein [Muribaculaceae bacterium]
MKRKEVLQGIIMTMQRELPFSVIERDLQLPIDSEQIVTVSGVRRCGKSSIMKIVANTLLEKEIDRKRILWINFDDERLYGMSADELDEVIQAYREMFPDILISELYIFFDEIQAIDGWELFVLRLYKSYCKNIYLSGSNAKMLSSQIATALRGWPLEYQAFPLAFDEYLRFKGVDASQFTEEGRAKLIAVCREYLHASAFPEVVLMEEKSLQIRKVQGYFNTMLFRDLIEHYSLSSPETVRYFLKRLMANLSKPTSINAIFNDLKSQGKKLDKNKLYELADMACDIFMFFKVNRWSESLIKENARSPKYYCIDNGMRNAVIMPQSDDDGKLLENAVFLHLRRHLDPMKKITYFNEDVECDFVVQQDEHIDKLIQVCWTLADSHTLQREIRGLKIASDVTGCRDCSIITLDESDEIISNGIEIKVLPVWKWLLSSPFE